jgi:signal transduction histidine kinase
MRGTAIEFSVQDNGRGIPAAVLSEFQTTGGGSGIGLMGMRERIYDLHGQFDLESNASGTRINVILPSTQSDTSPTEPEHNRHIGPSRSSSTDSAPSKPIMKAVAALSPG